MYIYIYIHTLGSLYCSLKSSKMAHFVFKCNKEDYLSIPVPALLSRLLRMYKYGHGYAYVYVRAYLVLCIHVQTANYIFTYTYTYL